VAAAAWSPPKECELTPTIQQMGEDAMAKKNYPDDPTQSQQSQQSQTGQMAQTAGVLPSDFPELMRVLALMGINAFAKLPFARVDLAARLSQRPRVTVAFPPCSEELLGLVKSADPDEITSFFREYFKFRRHVILGEHDKPNQHPSLEDQLRDNLDPDLIGCLGGGPVVTSAPQAAYQNAAVWPSECCICPPCVTLDGNRNPPPSQLPPPLTVPSLKRLFIGDALWAFYFDRMGVHQILGAILDAFAYNGRLPISNGTIDLLGVKDDIIALVLEVMVRQTKTGMSSTVRDRNSLFRTALGWVTESGRKLNLDTQVSTGFNQLFHKFVFHAYEFYRDKRLAIAIQGAAGGIAKPSVATLVTISETIEVLKKRFEAFDYGRNYYNTLSAIVWTIAGLTVIRELRTTLGIPSAFDAADEFVPAAYDLLVLKRPVQQGGANRYIVHRECARNGRDVLLDMEVVNHLDAVPGGELEDWLTQVEAKVEAYRTSYQTLTGVDLGASPTATIEQQA
jgi:hypothetical protein